MDMLVVKNKIDQLGITLIGPNCPGIITPDEAKLASCQAIFIKKVVLVLFLDQVHLHMRQLNKQQI